MKCTGLYSKTDLDKCCRRVQTHQTQHKWIKIQSRLQKQPKSFSPQRNGTTCFQLLKTKLNAEGSQSRNDCTYNMFTSEMFSTAYEHKFKIKSLLTWWVIFSLAFSFSLNNQSHLILKNTIRQRQQDPTTRAAPVWECSCRKNEGGRSVLFKWQHRWKIGQ